MSVSVAAARWGTVVGVGGASAAVGLWLRSLGLFSAGAAMIALRASAAPFGAPPSLEALGLDLPPLPIALAVPIAAIPALRWDPIEAVAVSALASGLAAWWLARALRSLGVGRLATVALVAAVALHPAWLYAAASGSGSVVAAALLIAALGLYSRWERTGDALPLLVSAFAMALAGLARYDMVVVGLAIAARIAVGPRARPTEPRDERPAFAIAYASAVAGALGLWIVVAAVVTGDALAFLARSLVAVAAPPAAQPPFPALLVVAPALAAAFVAPLARRGVPVALATALVAGAAVFASAASGSPLSLDSVVVLVPLTALLAGEISVRAPLATALAVPVLLLAGVAAFATSTEPAEAHRAALDVLRGREAAMWTGERALAEAVRGGSVLMDERVDAVAALLVRSRVHVVSADALPTDAPAPALADLVVVRTPTGRGAAHRVAAAWPTLYDGGTPWARRVGSWPVGGEPAEYRLYAVLPVRQP